ncbi:heavy metal translocating P-type ATPase [Candidatus Woesearchaeota archaeon]|nr:heavy metal translocating P-type ATPase [Candidatus Woesearchaeota archaeon]
MKKTKIHIYGMHCASCVKKIEHGLKDLKGIKHVDVVLEDDFAKIKYDDNKITLDNIKDNIETLGYSTSKKNEKKDFFKAILYGLVPHVGCVFFVIGSIFGASLLTTLFKPMLMNRYFFYILIGISLVFATLSSILYLKQNKLLSLKGIKKHKIYLSTMYGITVGVNLLLFFVVFPLTANLTLVSAEEKTNDLANSETISTLVLAVDIPCSGHAPLITGEVKKLLGIKSVKFDFPNVFTIQYDSNLLTDEKIMSLDIFKSFSAKNKYKSAKPEDTYCGASCTNFCGASCDGTCGVCSIN